MYTETLDTAFLAVKLNFLLGLRVGELVALKWDDYININNLHIVREEVRNQFLHLIHNAGRRLQAAFYTFYRIAIMLQ